VKIGIIGQGFVGTAIKEGMSNHYEVNTFDIVKDSTCNSLDELVEKSDIIFVCLPTPMNNDGSCNTNIVEKVISDIDILAYRHQIVVIKSTIPPGTTERLNKEYEHINIVFNPEFLTEANFVDDFKNQDRIIIGGERPYTTKVRQMYSLSFPKAHIIKTSSAIAEMVKYLTNTFLSTKVSFANEMKQICDKLDIDYDKVVEYSQYDERLGTSHWAVPGPDGKLGFGGSCFPKDINALIAVARELGVFLNVLDGVWKTNLNIRPEQDWKELKGRAVIDE
jgi:nucleotide sugar dehydrogenase